MEKGDLIKCKDKQDMIETMLDLAQAGIETDFVYEHKGEREVFGWRW